MRKVFIVPIFLLVFLVGCASNTPWRKATVTTYELMGVGAGAARGTAESLKAQGVISDAQLAKIKEIFNKAQASYVAAGKALKLAGQVASAAERDAQLAEYTKFLSDFAVLASQLYDLIKNFKKITYNEVLEVVKNGGEI